MCFTRISGQRALIAKEDIICVKTMEVRSVGEGRWKSYIMSFPYDSGYHYTNDNFPLITKLESLESEGLHSFQIKEGYGMNILLSIHTSNIYTHYGNSEVGSQAAIECYIPKGTPYYRGANDEYLSRELVVVGRINKKRAKELLLKFQ